MPLGVPKEVKDVIAKTNTMAEDLTAIRKLLEQLLELERKRDLQ